MYHKTWESKTAEDEILGTATVISTDPIQKMVKNDMADTGVELILTQLIIGRSSELDLVDMIYRTYKITPDKSYLRIVNNKKNRKQISLMQKSLYGYAFALRTEEEDGKVHFGSFLDHKHGTFDIPEGLNEVQVVNLLEKIVKGFQNS